MRIIMLCCANILISSLITVNAQTEKVWLFSRNGNKNELRVILPGRGSTFDRDFVKLDDFHFVQFGVYPKSRIDMIKVPKNIGQIWVIYHPYTKIKGLKAGAVYIVKPFLSEELARKSIQKFKKKKIDCWYNCKLTGSDFELIGAAGLK